jgi:hypothetical protein
MHDLSCRETAGYAFGFNLPHGPGRRNPYVVGGSPQA